MLFLFLALFFPLLGSQVPFPENQIIIVENFISADVANKLQKIYKEEKQGLIKTTDNELSLRNIKSKEGKQLIQNLSLQVIRLIQSNNPETRKQYHLDHAGLYGRITGNFCPYHADNCYFSCPIHGKDQGILRARCPGNCPGSQYLPNHTYWREYTGLIYLNDDFEGGEILFEDGPCNKLYQKIIPIQAGMLVIAPNGSNFYHEVFPIRKGTRYSLHLWFTSDPTH